MVVTSVALTLAIVPRVLASSHPEVTVSGNGAGSTQHVTVDVSSNESVHQSNNTMVMTIQTAHSSTGGNSIAGSTGNGGNSVMTGNAMSENTVSVKTGENVVMTGSCGCQPASMSANVSGNGANSKTTVKMSRASTRTATQRMRTQVYNDQQAKAKTGNNQVKNATGSGMNTVETGSAMTTNHVSVESGSNVLGDHMMGN